MLDLEKKFDIAKAKMSLMARESLLALQRAASQLVQSLF